MEEYLKKIDKVEKDAQILCVRLEALKERLRGCTTEDEMMKVLNATCLEDGLCLSIWE